MHDARVLLIEHLVNCQLQAGRWLLSALAVSFAPACVGEVLVAIGYGEPSECSSVHWKSGDD